MLLFLDTSDLKKVKFALISSEAVRSQILVIPYEENFKTLEHLDRFLKKNKVSFRAKARDPLNNDKRPLPSSRGDNVLSQIVISSGPGSFTGLRVGASIAQSLKLALGIPVTVIKKNKVPPNLKKLLLLKKASGLDLDYGRPAIY